MAQATKPCPEAGKWEGFVLANLSGEEVASLVSHLQNCSTCENVLSQISQGDPLLRTLRGHDSEWDREARGEIDLLIQQLKQVRSASLSTAHEGDSINEGGSNPETYEYLSPPQEPDEIGRLGNYRVLEILGRGGMGVVFQAEDIHLKRLVGLKVMRPTLAQNETAHQRFLREAQITASLNHDHVVTIFQVGEENDVPFLAMPLLSGQSLESVLEQREKLPLRESLRIARETASGLAAAHDHGLIHRDIKPSNLWLEGDRRRVKILDFGLARMEESDVHITQAGMILGTPPYMSPEQAEGSSDIGPQADLFALGTLLYQMTTGQLPFSDPSILGILQNVRFKVPQPIRELRPEIPQPLANLIQKLHCKDPAKRPSSAHLVVKYLAAIEKSLRSTTSKNQASETVSLQDSTEEKPSPAPRAEKSDSEPEVMKTGATGHAQAEKKRESATQPATAKQEPVPPSHKRSWFSPKLLVAATLLLLGGGWMVWALFVGGNGSGNKVASTTPGTEEPPNPPRGGPLTFLSLVRKPTELDGVLSWDIIPVHHRGGNNSVAPVYSPDGNQLATCDEANVLRIWDAKTGNLVRAMITPGKGRWSFGLSWSPDGRYLICPMRSAKDKFHVWNVAKGKLERVFGADATGKVGPVTWSPDGKYLASGQDDGKVYFWEFATGKKLFVLQKDKSPYRISWSPDGKFFAVEASSKVSVHSVTDGKPAKSSLSEFSEAKLVGFSPRGAGLVYLRKKNEGKDWESVLWDPDTQKTVRTLDPTPEGQYAYGKATWLEGGKVLACGSGLWEITTGKCLWAVPPKIGSSTSFAYDWASDGKSYVAQLNQDNSKVCIDRESGKPRFSFVTLGPTSSNYLHQPVAWSPDGQVIATALSTGDAGTLWNVTSTTVEHLRQFSPKSSPTLDHLAWSPKGKALFCSASQSGGLLHDLKTNETYVANGQVLSFVVERVVAPKGAFVATNDNQGMVTLWKPGPTWEPLHQWKAGRPGAFSPEGNLLATHNSHGVDLWEVPSGKPMLQTNGARMGWGVCWSPNGKQVAAGNKIWDATTGKAVHDLEKGQVLAWSADGKEIVGWNEDKIAFWDTTTGKLLRTAPKTYLRSSGSTSFSPDLRHAVSHFWWNAAIITRTENAEPLAMVFSFGDGKCMAISPEGHYRAFGDSIEDEIRYVVQTKDGQQTHTPAEFAKKYQWKNDPKHVNLISR